jgi:hypothetical protein
MEGEVAHFKGAVPFPSLSAQVINNICGLLSAHTDSADMPESIADERSDLPIWTAEPAR